MPKTLLVAAREYSSTVMTKAFIFGAVILPVIIWGLAVAIPTLIKDEVPQMNGTIAIVDETGALATFLETTLSPEVLKMQREELEKMDEKKLREVLDEQFGDRKMANAFAASLSKRAIEKLKSMPVHELSFQRIEPENADLEALKETVRTGDLVAVVHFRSEALDLPESMLDLGEAFGVAPGQPNTETETTQESDDETIVEAEKKRPPAISVYTDKRMHVENVGFLRTNVANAVVGLRLVNNNINPELAQRVMRSPNVSVINVTEEGEREANEMADMLVPLGFMMLLWLCTFTGGQYLLTTTIEEKSSKVIEVLLSATSPMQLMTGKILGQGAVALTMVVIYGALAGGAIGKFGGAEYINPWAIVLVAPYFIMAFFFIACMMASIGSAVNDMREAQALMGPVIMIIMLPMLAWMPIVRSPDGMFATVASYIPPMTPFVMALRLGSTQPPGWFQIATTLVIGFAAVAVCMWGTAKIFRIGVLMFGKPPNLRTLLRWVWQA